MRTLEQVMLALSKGHADRAWRAEAEEALHALYRCLPSTSVEMIGQERHRQIVDEGYGEAHDYYHGDGSLARAAAAYALEDAGLWPWGDGWNLKDRVRNLVRAGALIAAEIDRLSND